MIRLQQNVRFRMNYNNFLNRGRAFSGSLAFSLRNILLYSVEEIDKREIGS